MYDHPSLASVMSHLQDAGAQMYRSNDVKDNNTLARGGVWSIWNLVNNNATSLEPVKLMSLTTQHLSSLLALDVLFTCASMSKSWCALLLRVMDGKFLSKAELLLTVPVKIVRAVTRCNGWEVFSKGERCLRWWSCTIISHCQVLCLICKMQVHQCIDLTTSKTIIRWHEAECKEFEN
jgi:hypothetical protein